MTLFERFQKLDIDFDAIGFLKDHEPIRYFCTPKDAKVLGWAGVDGIHYCRIPRFGEMIFAVSPSNLPGEYVHPIARDFEELLSLLLACGSMDAVEQAWMMSREQFDAYLAENRPSEAACAVLEKIRCELSVEPAENPYESIRSLQDAFDYKQIPFTKEYYETIGEEGPIPVPAWKVTFRGGMMPQKGRSGKEVRIDKAFRWGGELWHIPAAYLCTEGIVLDLFAEVEPEKVTAFIEKWDLLNEEKHPYTEEEQERIADEHPLNLDLDVILRQDGQELRRSHGCSTVWVPPVCVDHRFSVETDAAGMLAHYGFDDTKAWSIHRVGFPWEGKRPKKLGELAVKLMREAVKVPGGCFTAPNVGESITVHNPVTGQEHLLTVRKYETAKLDAEKFTADPDTEYPRHYTAMVCTLFPEPEANACFIKDRDRGDSPRRKSQNGILGGAIGLIGMVKRGEGEEYFHPDGSPATARAVCSSLHFAPAEAVVWQLIFREKRVEDLELQLL